MVVDEVGNLLSNRFISRLVMSDMKILEHAIALLDQFNGQSDQWAISLVDEAKEQLKSVLFGIK